MVDKIQFQKYNNNTCVKTKMIDMASKNKMKEVAAIIPAYNEEKTVGAIIKSTKKHVDSVIVIDDGSSDNTLSISKKYADDVIVHEENYGIGRAVWTGYIKAIEEEYNIVIQVDSDGQHDPSYIPKLLHILEEEDADMVIGSRWLNKSHEEFSMIRRIGIRFFTAEVNLIASTNITDVTSGFRAYRISLLQGLSRPDDHHWALRQTLESGLKNYVIKEVSVPMPPEANNSQFDLETSVKYPLRMMLITIKVLFSHIREILRSL